MLYKRTANALRMIFKVFLLYDRGWKLPRFRSAFQKPVSGYLRVRPGGSGIETTPSLIAQIIDPATDQPVAGLRQLSRVNLARVEEDYMLIEGIELIPDKLNTRFHACLQAWLLEPGVSDFDVPEGPSGFDLHKSL